MGCTVDSSSPRLQGKPLQLFLLSFPDFGAHRALSQIFSHHSSLPCSALPFLTHSFPKAPAWSSPSFSSQREFTYASSIRREIAVSPSPSPLLEVVCWWMFCFKTMYNLVYLIFPKGDFSPLRGKHLHGPTVTRKALSSSCLHSHHMCLCIHLHVKLSSMIIIFNGDVACDVHNANLAFLAFLLSLSHFFPFYLFSKSLFFLQAISLSLYPSLSKH